MRLVPDTPSTPLDIEVTEEEILADLLYPAPALLGGVEGERSR